jgi:hypothetical protein
MSETPETDAFIERLNDDWDVEFAALTTHAKKLERERDEARQLLKAATRALNCIHVEVGGWIKDLMDGGKR